jgi:hypothetical protein
VAIELSTLMLAVQSERNDRWGDHVVLEVRTLLLSTSQCALLG